MITGVKSIDRFPVETTCKNTDITGFGPGGIYNMHCLALMSGIPFGKSKVEPEDIDDSCFLNEEETKLSIKKKTKCQNYIPTKYVGSEPLPTSGRGKQFILYCRDGNPNDSHRVFGSLDGLYGYNAE